MKTKEKSIINQFNNCDHIQLEGVAHYDERRYFMFTPDNPIPNGVQRFRANGVAQQMTDGTFDFVARPWRRSQSVLIKKLTHGRVSKTKDDAIQLTLKVYRHESINVTTAIKREAAEAVKALMNYQLNTIRQ